VPSWASRGPTPPTTTRSSGADLTGAGASDRGGPSAGGPAGLGRRPRTVLPGRCGRFPGAVTGNDARGVPLALG
jgi:hypothetical protein